jgi:hypothetical protein
MNETKPRATPVNRVWLASLKVIDMAAFLRMRENGFGANRIAKGLGVTVSTAQKIMNGSHWQRNPARVREFNEANMAHLDPETGVASAEDLERFKNGVKRVAPIAMEMGVKDAADLVRMVGVPAQSIEEATRRLAALAGKELELPEKTDTEWFKRQIDSKLARAILFLDDVVMAQASPKDLMGMVSGLTTIRQLLHQQPTQIISYEQRMTLGEVGQKLLAECRRRGLPLEQPVIDAPYREVTH